MDIVLIAGLWLDGSAWDAVIPGLVSAGHRPVALTLPGQADGAAASTLDDQVATAVEAVEAAEGPVMVVGHSAAASLAWIATDARPDTVGRTVLIGGFPTPDGEAYASFFEIVDGAMPFPGWGPFEGADTADLDESARQRLAATMVGVPEGVALGVVRLRDDRRYDVPVTLVCPEFSPDEAKEWIAGGDLPELAKAKHLDLVDIDSGHWPMASKPAELARVLAEIAAR